MRAQRIVRVATHKCQHSLDKLRKVLETKMSQLMIGRVCLVAINVGNRIMQRRVGISLIMNTHQ